MSNTFKTIVAFSLITVTTLGKENVARNGSGSVRPVIQRSAALCTEPSAQVDLKINNVRARVFSGGDMWWNLVDGNGGVAEYEVPKGNGTTAMFAGSIWIGGYDGAGNLKVAGQTYRQNNVNEFYTGPIGYDSQDAMTTDLDICNYYDRIWKVSQNDVKNFIATGVATKDIREWPGNNDKVSNPKLTKLAPYEDVNNDGVYRPEDGDYPKYVLNGQYGTNPNDTTRLLCNDYIFGDETLWWVFNDIGNVKSETTSLPIGLEVRSQAFAFKTDNAINDMTFYKYQIINSSSLSFDSTYFGWWSDPDLGDATDDWAGCDTVLGLGYIYNATNNDQTATGYGINPPAVGVDFFQGPIGDDGKEIKMTMYRYYNNDFTNYGNPEALDDYYQYLTGTWKNGDYMTADNQAGLNTPASGFPRTNFLFPGDPGTLSGWSEASAGNPGTDKRSIQAAGKFTLQPGAVNYITVGVVWARKAGKNNIENVAELRKADDKAQGLFNSCFKTLDGPDAPDVQITELSNKIILSLKNFNTNAVEKYAQIDPSISAITVPDDESRKYKFQGYLIYQVKSPTVTSSSIIVGDAFATQTSDAKLIYQMDLKDNIDTIYNYFQSPIQTPNPEFIRREMVVGKNNGLRHSFEITTDAFNSNADLINHKSYYYLILSYAYNNFADFNVQNPDPENTQVKPFIVGRNNVNVVSAIPHPFQSELNGLVFNSEVGDGLKVTRMEGQGNAGLMLDLPNEEVDKALSGPDFTNVNPVYEFGGGPLNVTVYDPLYVQHGHFEIKLTGVTDQSTWTVKENETNSGDTSTYSISQPNSQIIQTKDFNDDTKIFEWGLTADINNSVIEAGTSNVENNNGFLGSSITFADSTAKWLTGLKDDNTDSLGAENWIRQEVFPGKDTNSVYEKVVGGTWAPFKLANKDSLTFGPKWTITSTNVDDVQMKMNGPNGIFSVDVVFTSDKSKWTRCPVFEMGIDSTLTEGKAHRFQLRKSPSVNKDFNTGDGVISTTDENDADFIDSSGMSWFPGYAVNIETGERLNMAFGENSSLTDDNGRDMKWNPTSRTRDDNGKIVFGGMHYIYVFNSRTTTGANDIPKYDYGKKFVKALRANPALGIKNQLYANISWTSIPLLAKDQELLSNEVRVKIRVARQYRKFNTNLDKTTYINVNSPVGYPRGFSYFVDSGTVVTGFNGFTYGPGTSFIIPTDTAIQDTTISSVIGALIVPTENGANPRYSFENDGMEPTTGDVATAKNALSLINVVPNPYYAYSSYDKQTNLMWAKITNLPPKCTVSIFTLNGTLIRRFNRDVSNNLITGTKVGQSIGTEAGSGNYDTSLDWDLKNQKGIPIASGAYIIHVDAPGLGERALKWFAVMRPISLDNY